MPMSWVLTVSWHQHPPLCTEEINSNERFNVDATLFFFFFSLISSLVIFTLVMMCVLFCGLVLFSIFIALEPVVRFYQCITRNV